MNRYTAFLVHLGISLLIFVYLAYLVVYVWYPDFFFALDGGWQGIRIIVAVDLVLGPALTLIVFKKGKPGLKMDLGFIAAFQAACLVAGTYVVYSERPLAMVYSDGQFMSMSADAYTDYGVEIPDISAFPGSTPKWLSVDLPEDLNEQDEIRGTAFKSARPLRTYPEYYRPFDIAHASFEDAFPQEDIIDRDQQINAIPQWLEKHGGTLDDYAFFSLGSRYEYVFLGVERGSREILGVLLTPGPR